MTKFWTLGLLAAAFIMPALPAVAHDGDDWIEKRFARQQSLSSDDTPSKAQRKRSAKAEQDEDRPAKRKKVARNDDGDDSSKAKSKSRRIAKSDDGDDDGTRPQRKQASKSRPRESISGGGGETGVASYYWEPQALASGGRFNPNAMTAAHKTLPFGTRVRVFHLGNGNHVDVVINDRGPYIAGRIIDLSKRAAQDIGMTGSGVARVRVAILGRN